jgi:hypothetical protein
MYFLSVSFVLVWNECVSDVNIVLDCIDDFAIVMILKLQWCRSKAMMVNCIVLIVYTPSILSVESDDGGLYW